MTTIEATFTTERDTKRTRRYLEVGQGPPIIGTIYVQKWALKTLTGNDTLPDTITVVVGCESGTADTATPD